MSGNRLVIAILVAAGILAVGWLDLATGLELQVAPLYLLPLAAAGWFLSRPAWLFATALAVASWFGAQYLGGQQYAAAYWAFNLLAQAAIFLVVALLVARLHDTLGRVRDRIHVDRLTGLPNRRSFFERAGSVISVCHRYSQPATLAWINLQDKSDRRKHEHVVKQVADTLSDTLRASDITARVDDDEFMVLLPETDEQSAGIALENLRKRIAQVVDIEETATGIGAVSCVPAPADITTMLQAGEQVRRRVAAGDHRHVVSARPGFA